MGLSHTLIEAPTATIEKEFKRLRAGGVLWVREDFSWALLEPRQGEFNWAPLDNLMLAARNGGVHVLGILDYSAPWASSDPSGHGDPFFPPSQNASFAAYASAVAHRYGSSGTFWSDRPSAGGSPLKALEIWNEPYGAWYWKPGPSPAEYAALVRATAPAIHVADPTIKVLMSGELESVSATGLRAPWLASLLRADPGLPALVDGLDVHPYPVIRERAPLAGGADTRFSFGRVASIHQLVRSTGHPLPIWITEVGWSTAPGAAEGVSETLQARYLVETIERSIGEWGDFVPYVFLFSWDRANSVAGDREHNYGVLNSRGEARAAWRAISSLLAS